MRFFKLFAPQEQKDEIENRFKQFLRMFKSVTDNLQLRNTGKNKSKLLMLQEALQPLDNSTDVFMMIIFTMYSRLQYRVSVLHIADLADSLQNGVEFIDYGENSYDILDGIDDACMFTINAMKKELRITPDDVAHEPMELLIDFKVQIETIKFSLGDY